MSRGDASVFFTEPISLGFLLAAVAAVIVAAWPSTAKKRDLAFRED
jgi:putative tricarboxylic transport membrane protein